MIRKLLIANRGEIAVRVIRTAREMGIATVAVYSDADREAMHVRLADEAVAIGASPAAESYLNVANILDAARRTGADAIHPGYGFLSERAEFSQACAEIGIVFVGPPANAMRLLGSKSMAKELAVQKGVPIVPGCFELGASAARLKRASDEIGYPVMLKASAGGGGRGMREVHNPELFETELAVASDEALRAFGDGAMMVEKLVLRPRHVEVQVMADAYGNVACLFERECSLQRRHQKLIEEAPSPYVALHKAVWPEMKEAARRLIAAAGYVGAGTVEFIVDELAGKFYFLEVNARLQVEHPVTEAITGLDLVRLQLQIASGENLKLPEELLDGNRAMIGGHSIEARIIAEDPAGGFLPSIGKILAWVKPRTESIRIDTGFGAGAEVTRFYDSLLAKVIAHGSSRAEAIGSLRAALLDFHVLGVKTNIGYVLDVLDHREFAAGRIDTGFLDREFGNWSPTELPPELGAIVAFAEKPVAVQTDSDTYSVWAMSDGFRNAR